MVGVSYAELLAEAKTPAGPAGGNSFESLLQEARRSCCPALAQHSSPRPPTECAWALPTRTPASCWEPQVGAQCGVHAANALLSYVAGLPKTTPEVFARINAELVAWVAAEAPEFAAVVSEQAGDTTYWDMSVVRAAVEQLSPLRIAERPITQHALDHQHLDVASIAAGQGVAAFLVAVPDGHFYSIVRVRGAEPTRWIDMDSLNQSKWGHATAVSLGGKSELSAYLTAQLARERVAYAVVHVS